MADIESDASQKQTNNTDDFNRPRIDNFNDENGLQQKVGAIIDSGKGSSSAGLAVILASSTELGSGMTKINSHEQSILVAGNKVLVSSLETKSESENVALEENTQDNDPRRISDSNSSTTGAVAANVQYRVNTSTEFARKRPNSFVPGNIAGSVSSGSNLGNVGRGNFDGVNLRSKTVSIPTPSATINAASNASNADKRRNTIAGASIPVDSSVAVPNANSLEASSLASNGARSLDEGLDGSAKGNAIIQKKDSSASKRMASLRRKKRDGDADSDEEFVKVGTKVDKGHVNFVQMYDMLTGIRTSVSRCEAKPDRALVSGDFDAAHKLAFDITGNELTPSSRYDFKFKDYAPWVFRNIRRHFKVDPAEYLVSLTGKYVLSELGSPGKSGSFFYFSRDYRFIIKTIHHTEHTFFLKILQNYYKHIKKYPNTLISRFFGLHRVKLPGRKKIHFVVMGNIFPSNKDIHAVYDLKGSTVGRMTKSEDIAKNPNSAVQKDLNWLEQKMRMKLGPKKLSLFLDQIKADSQFLCECGIMDYSLLLAIHYYSRGNSENLRDKSLSVFEPKGTESFLQIDDSQDKQRKINSAVRKAIVTSDPVALGPSNIYLPEELPPERTEFLFYKDEGGFRGAEEQDDDKELDELYYAGIIDILTPYNYVKKFEHAFKSINNDQHMISAVNPREYAKRFISFMEESVLFSRKRVSQSQSPT